MHRENIPHIPKTKGEYNLHKFTVFAGENMLEYRFIYKSLNNIIFIVLFSDHNWKEQIQK